MNQDFLESIRRIEEIQLTFVKPKKEVDKLGSSTKFSNTDLEAEKKKVVKEKKGISKDKEAKQSLEKEKNNRGQRNE